MSKEEMNEELSIDELKDVAGGYDPAASGSGIKRDPNTEEIITAHVGKEFLMGDRAPHLSSVLGTRARSKKLDRDQ